MYQKPVVNFVTQFIFTVYYRYVSSHCPFLLACDDGVLVLFLSELMHCVPSTGRPSLNIHWSTKFFWTSLSTLPPNRERWVLCPVWQLMLPSAVCTDVCCGLSFRRWSRPSEKRSCTWHTLMMEPEWPCTVYGTAHLRLALLYTLQMTHFMIAGVCF